MEQAEKPAVAAPKRSWPKLVGKSYEEASAAIKAENADLQVSKVLPGHPVSRDLRPERVRIMVDDNDVVIEKPYIG